MGTAKYVRQPYQKRQSHKSTLKSTTLLASCSLEADFSWALIDQVGQHSRVTQVVLNDGD